MKRLCLAALVFIMSVFVVSCGKTAVKKVSEDSRITSESFAIVEAVKDAYIRKDAAGIENNTTRDGFRAITGAMKSFDSAELTFNPVLVEIDEGNVSVNVSWKGVWHKGGKTTEERGMAVFVLKGMPLKIDAVLRANPFKYPD
ncbi:MAG: hypothetical protein HQL08_16140 [Nitrospirae bacterium]|nr:hypothetical protein [Nitrospirota bacterium]